MFNIDLTQTHKSKPESVATYHTHKPQDHVHDLCFGEQVLAELNTRQRFQEGDGPDRKEKKQSSQLAV